MAGFILRSKPDDGNAVLVGINSTTVAVGDVLWLSTGSTYYMWDGVGVMEQWNEKVVANEAVTAAASFIKGTRVTTEQLWEVESANNSNTDHNGDRMVPTDQNTINNTGTNSTSANAIVTQKGTIGAVADKRILVRFIGADGADPAIT